MTRDADATDACREVTDWIGTVVARDGFRVEPCDLAASSSWGFVDGAIAHHSGRFFRVVGLRDAGLRQPFIEQREVGTLAFVVRRASRGPQILVHAKVEPGNVNVAQVAPSVQATASNLDQVHGGARPWGAELISDPAAHRLSDTLESEQGTRFLGKLNRNMALLRDVDPPPDSPLRWIETATLLRLLDQDFIVNTDARSVLAAMPWDFLAPAGPFAGARGAFGEQLRVSFATPVAAACLAAVDDRLARARHCGGGANIVGLHDLQGWSICPDGTISSPQSPLRVMHIRVSSRSREVPQWDQPILDCQTTATADLWGTHVDGALRFGFGICREPGLARRAELGPTAMDGAGSDRADEHACGRVVMRCRQSDEGGRFFRDVTTYRIVDLDRADPDPGTVWLSLSEIRALLDRGGYFTNEARTLISVLMRYLVR